MAYSTQKFANENMFDSTQLVDPFQRKISSDDRVVTDRNNPNPKPIPNPTKPNSN